MEVFIIQKFLNVNMANIHILSVTDEEITFMVQSNPFIDSQRPSGNVTKPRNFPEY